MRRIFFFISLSIVVIVAKGQNNGIIKAVILDSADKAPILYATISILKTADSSLVSYTVTDKNGIFILRNLHREPSRLLISHVGYTTKHINISFTKDGVINLGEIYLSAKMLKEVIIKGERTPVIIKKDTIEFDAEAFKTRPNALVEDLLKKLPGVQIDHDGHITVNGKDISKIKVDGKDFFVNDPKIATRNLDAEMIAKVQIYDDRENDPDHLIPDYEVKKIINLKFKKAFKKGSLSKFIAAAGTQDKYDANGFYSRFEKDLQIAATANSNNLSGTGIFSDDTHGQGIYGGPSALIKSTTGNINFNNSYGKTFKLNGVYEYLDNVTDDNSVRQTQQFINNTVFNSNSTNSKHQVANNHALTIKAEWHPDSSTFLKYSPRFSYNYGNNTSNVNSSNSNNFVPLINTDINRAYTSGTGIQFEHDLNYYHKLNKKGVSISISNTLTIHPEHLLSFTNDDLISYTTAFQSDTLHKLAKTANTDDAGNISAVVHYPITKKISADVSISALYNRNSGDLLTYNQDLKTGLYNIFLQDQSSNLIRNDWQQNASPVFTYKFSDEVSFKAGLITRLEQISNQFNSISNNLNQHFLYLMPLAELRLDKVTFSYGNDVRQPAINDLQPITIVYSPLFTFIGNPNLKPIRLHSWAVNYSNFTQSQLFLNLSTHIVVETNTILREQTINAEGAQVSTPLNSKGRFTANMFAYAGKRFKKLNKWQINTITSASGAIGHNFFVVNQQSGYQNTQNIIFNEQLTANWNNVFEIRPAYSINYAITKYQLVDLKNSNYTTQKAFLEMDLYLPQKYTWNVNYTYSYNPLVALGFRQNSNLLSLSFARHVHKKDKGEIRITGYDLLNQNVSSQHYAAGNSINDIQYRPIRRYFLLTYTYRLSDFN